MLFLAISLVTSQNVLFNVGSQALPDLQAKIALLNTRKLIATHLRCLTSYTFD